MKTSSSKGVSKYRQKWLVREFRLFPKFFAPRYYRLFPNFYTYIMPLLFSYGDDPTAYVPTTAVLSANIITDSLPLDTPVRYSGNSYTCI